MDRIRLRRALLSMSDKEGLVDFASRLHERGVELVSTGGTASRLRDAGLPVVEVAELTGFPDLLDGRVKTLHPAIHGAILADLSRPAHVEALRERDIRPVDLVAIGLYPFEAAVRAGAEDAECVEKIDVGGPAMIRAAAKNHARVAVLTGPEAYSALDAELERNGGATTLEFRRRLAAQAFAHTASYDAAVAAWAAIRTGGDWPSRLVVSGTLGTELRYGENPHQRAALYRTYSRPGAVHAQLLQGKPCSYNNYLDSDAAFGAAAEFSPDEGVACVIVKHGNPCGVAVRATAAAAFEAARAADPESAFGGVVAFNARLDGQAAGALAGHFLEAVVAPGVADDAGEALRSRASLRVLDTGGLPDSGAPFQTVRSLAGGFLVQDSDVGAPGDPEFRVVSKRPPDPEERDALAFAWRVVKHVKSNAIVLARDRATIGVGAGQTSRIDAVRNAVRTAHSTGALGSEGQDSTSPAVLASDAFFPFPDGVEAARDAGVRAVVQPGGAKRDEAVIAAADAAGIAMVFTGMRHFRH